MIIDGLRPQPGQSVGSGLQDPGNDGDVEEEFSSPRARRTGGPKRRNKFENALSVSPSFVPTPAHAHTEPAGDPQIYAQTDPFEQVAEVNGH